MFGPPYAGGPKIAEGLVDGPESGSVETRAHGIKSKTKDTRLRLGRYDTVRHGRRLQTCEILDLSCDYKKLEMS